MLLWEVPRSRSEGEAAIILLGHLVDTNSLSIGQPDNESPAEGQAVSPSSAQVTQGAPGKRNIPAGKTIYKGTKFSLCWLNCNIE